MVEVGRWWQDKEGWSVDTGVDGRASQWYNVRNERLEYSI
jgi:hypothetical protein